MCDVIQMGEVEGHVESQLLHTPYINGYVQRYLSRSRREHDIPGKVSCKVVAREFSHHLANTGPAFQGLTVSNNKCSTMRKSCKNYQTQNLFCWNLRGIQGRISSA